MEIYFAPLSCSLATRIALYETGQSATFHQVTLSTKRLQDGTDYLAINPKGQVPALRTEKGDILSEGPAVLQFVADQVSQPRLVPTAGSPARYRQQMWLNYIATEVHKAVFYYLFNPATPVETKAFMRDEILPQRYCFLTSELDGREFIGDTFSVADAYLFTTLNWAAPAGITLSEWPVLEQYHRRIAARPAVARALSEELALR